MADPNPKYSQLDEREIFQRSFDESIDRIRVDAAVTATFGTMHCYIRAQDGDSIIISDGTNNLKITATGEALVKAVALDSIDSKLTDDYGVRTQALRTASQVGNSTGPADFNIGPTTFQTLRTSSNTSDGQGNAISSASYSGNQLLHISSPDNFIVATALTGINSTITIALSGLNSVGFQLNAGTLVGTIIAEASVDGGTIFTSVPFYDPANSAVLPSLTFSPNLTTKIVSVIPIGGSSHVRIRVISYTSGTATGLLRAANVNGVTGAVTASAFGQVSNRVVSITNNTPILVLASNVNRKYAYFGNSSSSTIRLQFASPTNLNNLTGIPIQNSLGFYELRGNNLFTGDVYAFSSSDVQISVTEGTP